MCNVMLYDYYNLNHIIINERLQCMLFHTQPTANSCELTGNSDGLNHIFLSILHLEYCMRKALC